MKNDDDIDNGDNIDQTYFLSTVNPNIVSEQIIKYLMYADKTKITSRMFYFVSSLLPHITVQFPALPEREEMKLR
jgi:hypothetical protein